MSRQWIPTGSSCGPCRSQFEDEVSVSGEADRTRAGRRMILADRNSQTREYRGHEKVMLK